MTHHFYYLFKTSERQNDFHQGDVNFIYPHVSLSFPKEINYCLVRCSLVVDF